MLSGSDNSCASQPKFTHCRAVIGDLLTVVLADRTFVVLCFRIGNFIGAWLRLTFLAMMGDAAFPHEAIAMMDVTSAAFSIKRRLSWPFIFMLCRLYNVCEVHQRKLQQLFTG